MDDLVTRLRKVEPDAPGERTRWYRNPDGPEAADCIEQLEAAYAQQQQVWSDAIARADCYEKALSRIYAWYPISVAQPHQTINDIREFARAALEEKKDD